jgi:hypothetical protein
MSKYIVGFLFIMTIISCGIKNNVLTKKRMNNIGSQEIIIKFNKNNNPPEWLFLEGEVSINERKENLKIVVKHKKDSITWASIRANLGIELFRFQITQDSVYFLDRLNSNFLIEPNSYLNTHFKINNPFTVLNSFITSSYKQIKDIKNIKNHNNDIHVLYLENNVEHHIFAENYKTYLYSFFEGNNKIECTHLEYKKIDKQIFPYVSTLKIFLEKEMKVKIETKNVVFDYPQKFKFKIPKRYGKIK